MAPPLAPFTEADLALIREAVAEAETGTAGEIVPYVVPASDEYPSAVWKGATFGALLGALLGWAVHYSWDLWGGALFFWMVVPAVAGAALGLLVASFVPAVKRLLAGDDLIELRTRRRAALAFLDEEVFRTRDRTGILLFVSLFEHRVVVLGDSGINQKVKPEEWDALVREAAAGIRAGRPGEAVARAVEACGRLLGERGVHLQPADTDELSNELRRGET
jgi:putative membrane protein